MATDGQAVVIGLSKAHYREDTSIPYCLEVLGNGEVTGVPFRLHNEDGRYIWENEQLRHRSISQGSLITFKRRPSWGSTNPCYTENTGKSLDINTILSQLQFDGSGYKAVVYQGIAEGFPTAKIENLKIYQDVEDGRSPACALISVKEATLEDRKIKFKTLLDEECVLKNNCRSNGGGGVEEVPLPVQVSSSNQCVSNCVLLVKFGSKLESESWDSDRHYAVCEAVLISQPGPFALGRRQDSSDGILAGSSLKSYGMNRNPRGKCIIINNSEFQDKAYNRPGAEFDEQALEALFEYLSFDVEIYQNLESRDMRDLVRTIASENHSESDALFVIVMSHGGDHDTILGVDQRNITVEEMMSEFKAARCKTLEGKPKVFIFQVCRGSSSEFLEHERRHTDNTVSRLRGDSTLSRGTSPQEADFLLAFATTPGYYSYRDEDHGTPFIQTLVEVLTKHHQESHLTEMLPEVTRCVVEKAKRDGLQSYIQVPSYSNSLRAKLYL